MLITPEIAKKFLETSRGNPRYADKSKVSKVVVKRYASDMKNGFWQLSPEGISFDETGRLIDGHHRLHAIIDSGCAVQMYVTEDVPTTCTMLDVGFRRTPSQVLTYCEGLPKSLSNSQILAMATLHFFYLTGRSREKSDSCTITDKRNFICENEDSIEWVYSVLSRKRTDKRILRNSPFSYAIFCAEKVGVSREILEDFSDSVASGFYDGKEKSASILARNEMYTRRGDIVERVLLCDFIQMCIYDYERGIPRTRRYNRTNPIYTKKYLKIIISEET